MRDRWLVVGTYGYSAVHILACWCFLSSNGLEPWLPAVRGALLTVFLPLTLAARSLCRIIWGSWNIFQAKTVFGLFGDMATASLLSASVLAVATLAIRRQLRARRNGATG